MDTYYLWSQVGVKSFWCLSCRVKPAAEVGEGASWEVGVLAFWFLCVLHWPHVGLAM